MKAGSYVELSSLCILKFSLSFIKLVEARSTEQTAKTRSLLKLFLRAHEGTNVLSLHTQIDDDDDDTHPAPVPEAFDLLHLKLVRFQNTISII